MNIARARVRFDRCIGFAVLACAGIGVASPQVARACSSLAPPPTLNGVPADGDTDVPTDVVPYYAFSEGIAPNNGSEPSGEVPGTFTLTAQDGTVVDVTARVADWWNYELVPAQPLAPHTTYVLHAEWPGPTALMPATADVHFVTGDGPLTTPPAPPSGRLIHYKLDEENRTSCSPELVGTCISVADDDAIILATYIDSAGQTQDTYGHRGSYFGINISGQMQGTPDQCVQLRTRALNGTLSDPLELCGMNFPVMEIHGTEDIECSSAGLSPMQQPIVPMRHDSVPFEGPGPSDAGQPQAASNTPVTDAQPRNDTDPRAMPAAMPETQSGAAMSADPMHALDNAGKAPKQPRDSGGCSASSGAPRPLRGAVALLPFAWLAFARRRRIHGLAG